MVLDAKIGLDDLLGDGCGRGAAVSAVLHEGGNGDLGILGRGVGHEPRVIPDRVGQVLALDGFPAHFRELGGAGLAGDVHDIRARPLARTSPAMDHLEKRPAYDGQVLRLQIHGAGPNRAVLFHDLALGREHLLDEPWAVHRPSVGNSGHQTCHLQRSHPEVTLADGHERGFAGVPPLPETSPLPRPVGNQPGAFAVNLDARGRSESETPRVPGDLVDTEPLRQLVEVDVARLHQGLMHGHMAVPVLLPIPENAITHLVRTVAEQRLFGGDDAFLQRGQCGDDLERRARRKMPLQCPVVQRVFVVRRQFTPLPGRHAPGE